MNAPDRSGGLGRRAFLRSGALAGLGVGLRPRRADARPAARAPARVQRYATLGLTGLRVSDISFGGSGLGAGEAATVRHALERGVNYFDTADSYRGGESERTLGEALRGTRDRVFIASKLAAGAGERRDSMMRSLEQSLGRLRTDYVDVHMNHAVNDVARLRNPEWREFTTRAKQEGKIRFVGMSGHAGRLVECVDHAVASDSVDVLLVAYHFGQDPAFYQRLTRGWDFIARQPDLPGALARAKARGIGVVAMKTLMGARLNDMRPFERDGATFAQAAFRWVLTGGLADALIVSMTGPEAIDEYLGASGARGAASGDRPLLERYARVNGASCRPACDACLAACPAGVAIGDVLRARMYAVDYGDRALARGEYARLEAGAAPCLACAHRACRDACPHGVAIPRLAASTHRMLTV